MDEFVRAGLTGRVLDKLKSCQHATVAGNSMNSIINLKMKGYDQWDQLSVLALVI